MHTLPLDTPYPPMDYDTDTEGDHKDSRRKGAPMIIFSFLLLTEPGFNVNMGEGQQQQQQLWLRLPTRTTTTTAVAAAANTKGDDTHLHHYPLEDEHECSSSRVVVVHHYHLPPPSKMSAHAHLRGWWCRCVSFPFVLCRSFSRVVVGFHCHHHLPPASKTSGECSCSFLRVIKYYNVYIIK